MPCYAQDTAADRCQAELDALTFDIALAQATRADVGERAMRFAERWEEFKVALDKMYTDTSRECKRKILDAHRQRVHRLNKAMREAVTGASPTFTVDGLLEDEPLLARELRSALARRKVELQATRVLLLGARHVHRPALSTKDFYQRIATKYLDNGISQLATADDLPTSDPKRMTESWPTGWRAP